MALLKKMRNLIFPPKNVDFYRKLGVSIGKNCEIYENVSFGSEPYLVSMGEHVRVTKGVQFITHDGGVWVLRKKYNKDNIDIFGKITIGNNVPDGEIWGGVSAKKLKVLANIINSI